MLAVSVVLINLALITYSISIWNEFRRKTLLPWHIAMFCIGFICDFSATFMMYRMGGSSFGFSIHDILGYTALVLMLCNAIFAIYIFSRKDRKLFQSLCNFGIFSWFIWIVSYIVGMAVNMSSL